MCELTTGFVGRVAAEGSDVTVSHIREGNHISLMLLWFEILNENQAA